MLFSRLLHKRVAPLCWSGNPTQEGLGAGSSSTVLPFYLLVATLVWAGRPHRLNIPQVLEWHVYSGVPARNAVTTKLRRLFGTCLLAFCRPAGY